MKIEQVFIGLSDTTTPPELSAANEDPLELPVGPVTRTRAKRFKDATTALVDRVWGETVAGLLESSWTSKPSKPCILLQAQISSTSTQLSSTSSFQLISLLHLLCWNKLFKLLLVLLVICFNN